MCAVDLGFHHVGVSVADLDRARRFYIETLGFTEQVSFEIPGPGIRGVMVGNAQGARLELLERDGSAPGPRFDDPPHALLTQGYGHWALEVEDVDATCSRLAAAGAEVVWDPREAPEPGARMAYLRDPDGNLFELVQPAES
jgi:catechol 2,3-dioxygenase-like lactoylglutathione lyase family enzyme